MRGWGKTRGFGFALCVALACAVPQTFAQDSGVDALKAEIERAMAAEDLAAEVEARIRLGQRHMTTGNLADAIALLEAADVQAQQIGDDRQRDGLRARALGTLGIALNNAGLHGEALDVQQHALRLFESLGDKSGIASVTVNIGATLDELGDAQASRRTLERALALKREEGVEKGVGSILNNLADIEEREGDLERAEALLREALESHLQAGSGTSATLAKANLSRILGQRGDFEGALALAQEAQADAQAQDFLIGKLTAQTAQVDALMRMIGADGVTRQRRDELARRAAALLENALIEMQPLGDDGRRAEVLRLLSDVRQAQNRLPEALDLLRQAGEAEERQQRRRNADRATVMAARFEQERQAREIAVLREAEVRSSARLDRQRNVLFLLLLLLGLGATVFVVALQRLRHQRNARAQLTRHNMELSAALEQARLERRRAESYAERQRRFLNLASVDMRRPLIEMRSVAEHAMVTGGKDNDTYAWSAVANSANDLLWVTEQMLESAALPEADGPLDGVHPVDPAALLRDLVAELQPRAAGLGHELRLQLDEGLPRIAIQVAPCMVALRELSMILLKQAAPRTEITIRASAGDGRVSIAFATPSGRLPDWDGGDSSANNLALEWIRHAITDSGGTIHNDVARAETRRVVIEFPVQS